MCLGVETPAMVQRPPRGDACAGCSLQGGCAGLLLSIKVTSPYSKPSGTFIFNPSHEQFSRHILVLKGHRQGEPAPPRLAGWSCCQAARAGAVRSLEQPHPSSPGTLLSKSSWAAGGDARERRASSRAGGQRVSPGFVPEAGDASQQTHAQVGVGCSAEAKRSVPS